jgi:hypothetical protein
MPNALQCFGGQFGEVGLHQLLTGLLCCLSGRISAAELNHGSNTSIPPSSRPDTSSSKFQPLPLSVVAMKPLVLHSDNEASMTRQHLCRVAAPYLQVQSRLPTKTIFQPEGCVAMEQDFVQWYNHEHKHCGLKFVTPQQRHLGLTDEILAKCKARLKQTTHSAGRK